MKKFIVILSLGLLTLGITSCEDALADMPSVTESVEDNDTETDLDNTGENDPGGEEHDLPVTP